MLTDALLADLRRRRAGLVSSFALPLALLTSLTVSACGGAASEGASDASTAAAKKAEPTQVAAPGHMLRADVDRALSQGPSWLLRRVVPREVIKNGAFVGWLIVAMPEEWGSVGLKPGDVVTRVNGASIEKPDDLWKAWVILMAAPELKVAFERDGAAKEIVVPIDGTPTLTEAALQARMGSMQREPGPTRRRETIVIPGSDPAPSGAEYSAP